MSNSSLVNYTKISPNKNSPRNHSIDTITIHHMAGNLTVETCGNVFAASSRQASSNYGIGSDGRIALYVDEGDRSWCSSNKANDNRAVTIEVADDGGAETGWHVSSKAMDALVNLCVDICKRNSIKKLIWSDDKADRVNHRNGCNMTVHRDFAATACPGDYLFSQMSSIAASVNSRLIAESTDDPVDKIIWNFLKWKGLSDVAAAGIMGNLYAESGLRPDNLQNSFEKRLGLTDAQYTAKVDDGSYTNFVRDGAGYGLAQWTFWTRKQNLLNFAKAQGKSIGNLNMQLDFLWSELQGYKAVMEGLNAAQTVFQASNVVLLGFEKPADQSAAVQKKRADNGQTFLNIYGKETPSTGYVVRITASVLNVRAGAGTGYPVKTTVKNGEAYTIVAESNGWGKLKSGAGWISLAYTQRV